MVKRSKDKGMSKKKDRSVETFVEAWERYGLQGSDLTTQHRFHPTRRWLFDIAWPSIKFAVEIDGFGYGHQSKAGRISDNEKQNEATRLGWRLVRLTTADITSSRIEETVEYVKEIMCSL